MTQSNLTARTLLLMPLLCLSAEALPDSKDEVREAFDIPSGSYEEIYVGPLGEKTTVICVFKIEQAYFGPEWNPSLGIVFSSEDVDGDFVSEEAVKLSAAVPDQNGGWRYRLSVMGPGDRKSEITARTGSTSIVVPLIFGWTADRYVLYTVGDDFDESSLLDVSQLSMLNSWRIVASGVRGTASCSATQK